MLLPATAFAAGTTYLPTYLPIHGLTLLSVLEENWIKLTKIDRSFAAMAQQIALRHNYHVSQYQLLPEAGWGSLAGNLATRNCDNIYSKIHAKRRMGCNMHRYCIYSIIAHIIVSSIPSRYHMTWRTVWCLFFTALIGRWLGLGFARMLFLHVLGIMLSLCSWRHLELRHCSKSTLKDDCNITNYPLCPKSTWQSDIGSNSNIWWVIESSNLNLCKN